MTITILKTPEILKFLGFLMFIFSFYRCVILMFPSFPFGIFGREIVRIPFSAEAFISAEFTTDGRTILRENFPQKYSCT